MPDVDYSKGVAVATLAQADADTPVRALAALVVE